MSLPTSSTDATRPIPAPRNAIRVPPAHGPAFDAMDATGRGQKYLKATPDAVNSRPSSADTSSDTTAASSSSSAAAARSVAGTTVPFPSSSRKEHAGTAPRARDARWRPRTGTVAPSRHVSVRGSAPSTSGRGTYAKTAPVPSTGSRSTPLLDTVTGYSPPSSRPPLQARIDPR